MILIYYPQMQTQACPFCLQARMLPAFDYMMRDQGPNPFVTNIHHASKENNTFRTVLWTGRHVQLTVMSLQPGEDIGLERHPHTDQFLRIEQGVGVVQMGESRDNLNFQHYVGPGTAILVPAGTWHNLINTGSTPMKLYTIYGPPNHPHGTVHQTKADAEKEHH